MVTIFQKGRLFSVMHGQYKPSFLPSVLTFLIRSILHDPETFTNPLEFQPERYLKDITRFRCDGFGLYGIWFWTPVSRSNTFYDVHLMRYFSQNLSRKTLKRQLLILNCILPARSLRHKATSWRPGYCHQAQARIQQWISVVRMKRSHKCKYTLGWHLYLNRYPLPFKCIIRPRTPGAEALIRDSVNEESWDNYAEASNCSRMSFI